MDAQRPRPPRGCAMILESLPGPQSKNLRGTRQRGFLAYQHATVVEVVGSGTLGDATVELGLLIQVWQQRGPSASTAGSQGPAQVSNC